MVEPYLLDCNYIIGELVPRLVDHTVGALANLADALVTLDLVAARVIVVHA